MPAVLRKGPCRFFVYSSDGAEPPHVRVHREEAIAKFRLDTVRYDHSAGFRAVEIRRLQAITEEHNDSFVDAWHGHFSN